MATACIISSGSDGSGNVIATVTEPLDCVDEQVKMKSQVDGIGDVASGKHLLQVPGQDSVQADDEDEPEEEHFEDE